jgi:filamentous hemagglutinin family protein
MSYHLRIASLIIAINLLNVQAEVVLDGSFGRNESLSGPNFDIGANLGQQVGTNLFHSFQTFNLNQSEIATFSGPNQIRNVISRVTGGNKSTINGTLRSLMPQADMYFLNPAGIIIGEQAKLDVQGAMHFSTADELHLGKDGKFVATNPQNSLLTVAPPSAFGFLSDTPGTITLQGSQIMVSEGKTLSLIGGDIDIQENTQLKASEGRLNMASVNSQGKVTPTSTGLERDYSAQGGNLSANHAKLDVSGDSAGSIYIRAGQFKLDNSEIFARPQDQDGEVIDITVTDLMVLNSLISNSTYGAGKGGAIIINAEGTVMLSGLFYGLSSNALSDKANAGYAGNISVNAKNLSIFEGSRISSSTWGPGKSGKIDINITDTITLSDALIATTSESIKAGNAGEIAIKARNLTLTDGAQITSSTFGQGEGGKITINVADTISLAGALVLEDYPFLYSSGLFVSAENAETTETGSAGTVELTAKHLEIKEGAGISSITYSSGQGGQIHIDVAESIKVSGTVDSSLSETQKQQVIKGIVSASKEGSTGNAGHIVVNTPLLILFDEGRISTSAEIAQAGEIELNVTQLQVSDNATITSESAGAGDAGNIHLVANRIDIKDAKVSTEAAIAAGGNITVNVPNLLYLQKGAITTSVKGDAGGGGDIDIKTPAFVVLNNGKIIAQAVEGDGGNITIKSEQFIATKKPNESIVDASSQKGIDGVIVITAPESDISGQLLALPGTFYTANQVKTPCHIAKNRGSFIVLEKEGVANSPGDLQPSGPFLSTKSLEKTKTSIKKPLKGYQPSKPVKRSTSTKNTEEWEKNTEEWENSIVPPQLF